MKINYLTYWNTAYIVPHFCLHFTVDHSDNRWHFVHQHQLFVLQKCTG